MLNNDIIFVVFIGFFSNQTDCDCIITNYRWNNQWDENENEIKTCDNWSKFNFFCEIRIRNEVYLDWTMRERII